MRKKEKERQRADLTSAPLPTVGVATPSHRLDAAAVQLGVMPVPAKEVPTGPPVEVRDTEAQRDKLEIGKR